MIFFLLAYFLLSGILVFISFSAENLTRQLWYAQRIRAEARTEAQNSFIEISSKLMAKHNLSKRQHTAMVASLDLLCDDNGAYKVNILMVRLWYMLRFNKMPSSSIPHSVSETDILIAEFVVTTIVLISTRSSLFRNSSIKYVIEKLQSFIREGSGRKAYIFLDLAVKLRH